MHFLSNDEHSGKFAVGRTHLDRNRKVNNFSYAWFIRFSVQPSKNTRALRERVMGHVLCCIVSYGTRTAREAGARNKHMF